MKFINQYPTATAGLALGLSTALWVWSLLEIPTVATNILLIIAFVVALALILPILIRFSRHPGMLYTELKDPTVGSVAPTLTLTLMILAYFISKISTVVGSIIWIIAIIAHFCFFLTFAYQRIKTSQCFQSHILPSWFIPTTGMIVACITQPSPVFRPLSEIIFIFGTVCYVILMPLVLYRLCLGIPLKEGHKATLALLTTPSNLILAGALVLFPHTNPLFGVGLFGISCLTSLSVYVMLVTLLRMPFTPAYAAFTFPLAVAAEATLDFSHWALQFKPLAPYSHELHILGLVQLVIASLVIIYVGFHFIRFFNTSLKAKDVG